MVGWFMAKSDDYKLVYGIKFSKHDADALNCLWIKRVLQCLFICVFLQL